MKLLRTLMNAMKRRAKPTHASVTRLIASLLPIKENDVPRAYHVPRNPRYDPETAVVDQVVLSVTPTPGVYSLIGYTPEGTSIDTPAIGSALRLQPRPPRTLCFLHRPFTLNRRSVRRGTLVVSSHTCFDELLTVGWNTALADRLGMSLYDSICVQGYKGDPERKIGIIGRVSTPRELFMRRIQQEFGEVEVAYEGPSDEILAVAIMNAFNEEEVYRVLEMAVQAGWVGGDAPGKHILYLTGQPRLAGVQAASMLDISVACVGHRPAEDWGIRYLAANLRDAYPGLLISEVYEEEEPPIKKRKADISEVTTIA